MLQYPNLFCDDQARRQEVAASEAIHGIDYLEVVTAPSTLNQRALDVYFIRKTTPAGQANLDLLLDDLQTNPARVQVLGGVRTRDIKVLSAERIGERLRVRVSEPGDFSDYTLRLEHSDLDLAYTQVIFSFKAGCPSRFDCRPGITCPPEKRRELRVDYLARDYASFRQALIDLIPTLVPDWTERHAADLGMTLIELLAYLGDHLSYFQDAVANEAFLDTARQRISVRRHARLVDYRMHDGASARAFVHFNVLTAGVLPAGTQLLTRLNAPLRSQLPPHGPVIAAPLIEPALAAADAVFETMAALTAAPQLDEIAIHAWGNRECCLPRGATSIDLVGDLTALLARGDFLLLEEVVGPATGLRADADPTHRQVVRITQVESASDLLSPDPVTGVPPLPLTRVRWGRGDALSFPICLSSVLPDDTYLTGISVARGNLVLADHGREVEEWHPADPADPAAPGIHPGRRAYRFRLKQGPLSQRIPMPSDRPFFASVRDLLLSDPRQVEQVVNPCAIEGRWPSAQVQLTVRRSAALSTTVGGPVPDLLESDEFALDFVVEIDNSGRATIRFGDGTFGLTPPEGAHIKAAYRVGVGASGNVGREALAHVIDPGAGGAFPMITGIRNPLPAWGGVEPEPIEQVKRLAPAAFRAVQYRAVTEADYARAAEKHADVSKAVATFRWTGSWLTVFLSVDPAGRANLDPVLAQKVRDWVRCVMQTGYDLEIRPPIFVPLEIELDVCVKPSHFRADVEKAVLQALSNRTFADGTRGFFHPDNFTFGQAVHLGQIYAAVEAVDGVDAAVARVFLPFGRVAAGELENAIIPIGRLEIARLDNDPSLPENGVLQLNMLGGK